MKKTKFKVGITFILTICISFSSVLFASAFERPEDEHINIAVNSTERYGISEHDENNGFSRANIYQRLSDGYVRAELATISNDSTGTKTLDIKIRLWGEGNVGLINNGSPLRGTGNQTYSGGVSSFNHNNQGFFTILHEVYNTNTESDWEVKTQYIWGYGMLGIGMYNPTMSIG